MPSEFNALSCVLYAAKSTQDKHGSIPSQLEEVRAMADREGWRVVSEHRDEGFSAYSGNRGPGLEAAKRAAAKAAADTGRTCMLVAWRSDRFARGAGDEPGAANSLVEIWHEMRRKNVHLRTVRNDYAMHDPVLLAVEAKRIYEESKQKSADVKKGQERRRMAGKHHGGPRAFGIEYRDGERHLVDAEVPVVQRIFNEYLAGHAQQAISRNLNDDGVATARGGRWYQGTVRGIIANDMYVELGVTDEATFQKASKLRETGRKSHSGGRHPKGRHLFRKGMLRCECGEPMVTRTGPNRASEPYEVYICYARLQDTKRCAMPPLRRADLDEAALDYFNRAALDREATAAALRAAQDRRATVVEAELRDAEREAQKATERLARVKRDYTDGKLDADDWREFKAELTAELDAAMAVAKRLRRKAKEVEAEDELQPDAEAETLRRLAEVRAAIAGEVRNAADVDAVRAALKKLFESFTVTMPKDGRATILPKRRVPDGYLTDLEAMGAPPELLEGASGELVPRRVPLEIAERTEAAPLTT